MGQLKPDEENQYYFYSFWSAVPSEDWETTETNEELRREFETYFSFDAPVGKLHLYSYLFPSSSKFNDYVEVLGIDEFPTFVILDSEGVVLKTTDVQELLDFINDLPYAFVEE